MEIKAKLNYLRIAPRKVRLVADLVRGMDVKEAETQLKFIPNRVTEPLLKLLKSGIANAKNNFNAEKDVLYIKELNINEGPPFKRWRPVSRGRAFPIMKRTSHIDLVLGVKPSFVPTKVGTTESREGVKIEKPSEKVRPKYRVPKKITKKPESKGLLKKIFRRKSFG